MDWFAWSLGLGLAAFTASTSVAADVSVAVAANFTRPAEEIGAAFTAKTGDTVSFSFGATGTLYAQIAQAAPFEVFLAADSERPAKAETDGFAVAGTGFTYATGRVVLYSTTIDVTDGRAVLQAGAFQHLAIADPRSAPYGKAGFEVMDKLGLADALTPKVVTGENISQTLQFIESGNAELGFVALSQVVGRPASQVWLVPAEDHSPILQDAVLLKAGEADPAARAFIAFLKGPEAAGIITKYGYQLPR